MTGEQLRQVLAESIALDQLQRFRHVLLIRCGLLAAVAVVAALTTHVLSRSAWAIAVALLLAAPLGAWIAELRCGWRLSRKLDIARRVTTTSEKVVTSS